MNDWNDRAIDAALHELHGSVPPDLSARVLVALRQEPVGQLPRLLPKPRRWLPLVALLLVSLALGVAAAMGARWWTASADGGDVLAIALDVHRGRVECVEGGAVRAIAAGESAPPFAARPGNRLRTPVASSLRFDAFGRLDAAAHTELEVRSMDVTRKNGIVVASSLTLAVVSGGVGWYAGSHTETARAGEMLHVQAPASGEAVAFAAENQQLKNRVQELEQRNEKLLAQISARESAPPPVAASAVEPDAPKKAAEPASPAPPTFTDAKFADALSKIDWESLGAVSNDMAPLLTKLAEAMDKEDAELPVDVAVQLQTLNQKLVEPVVALMKSGIPGFGPNGSYTNPLVVGNMLAGTLSAAGQPLTSAQQQQIDGLVRTFAAESQTIADAPHDIALEGLLAETEMKDRFYKEVGSMLSPEQYAKIYPEGASKYDGTSLFSTGVLMHVSNEPVNAKDAADYARVVSGKLQERLGLDDAAAAQVRAIIAQSSASAPLWNDRASPVETAPQVRFLRSGRTQAALRAQLDWMRAIQQQVPLTDEQKRKLAKSPRVLVPLPR